MAASSSQRGSCGQFALSRGGADEQKITDVGARDKQHETDRSEQNENGRPSVANDRFLQRDHAKAVLRTEKGRIEAAVLVRRELHPGVGHLQRYSRSESCGNEKIIGKDL